MPETHIAWSALRWAGFEILHLRQEGQGVDLDGRVLAVLDGEPVRLRYDIRCDGAWRVRSARVERDGPGAQLALRTDGDGGWLGCEGEVVPALQGCTDVDLAITPATNALPIRRLGLAPGESREILAAYVEFPSLALKAVRQRYTRLASRGGRAAYRYESRTFRTEFEVDAQGLVVDYPDVWRREAPRP